MILTLSHELRNEIVEELTSHEGCKNLADSILEPAKGEGGFPYVQKAVS
jgi:hypothetical protein